LKGGPEKPDGTVPNLQDMIFMPPVMVVVCQIVCLFYGQCPSDEAISQQNL
jgi:hypothetical protein